MTKKYLLQIGEEIDGPLTKEEADKIISEKKGDYSLKIKELPDGSWESVEEKKLDATFIVNINELRKKNQTGPKEFVFDHVDPFENEELEIEEATQTKHEESIIKEPEPTPQEEKDQEKEDITKTEQDNTEKTKINKLTKQYLKELEAEKRKQEELEKKEKENEVTEVDFNNEATQMLDLEEVKKDLLKAVKEDVKQQKEQQKIEVEKKKKEKELKKEEAKNSDKSKGQGPEKKKDNKKKILVIAVLGMLLLFLLPEKKKKKEYIITIKDPNISFPIQFDKENKSEAQRLYKEGLKYYANGNYENLLKSAKLFKVSSENSFKNNPATAKLISTYSRVLKNSIDKNDDANTIFRLVQIFSSKALQDPSYAAAFSMFYYANEKYSAAIRLIENYLTLEGNSPTLELFAIYLQSLVRKGNFIQAQKVTEKLEGQPQRGIYVYKALIDYYESQGELNKISELLEQSLKKHNEDMFWMITKGNLLLKNQDWKELKNVLLQMKRKSVGYSRRNHAEYLRLKGFYLTATGKVEDGTKDLKKSLELYENLSLVSQLAELEGSNSTETNNLILESRAKKFLFLAKGAYEEGFTNQAFKYALEATNTLPSFIEAQLFLSKLQIEQGYINDAIKKLEALYKENKSSNKVLYSLTDAYIRGYKFKEAQRLLNLIVSLSRNEDDAYESLTARYFIYKDDFNKSVGWIQKAINKNPLNDENIFEMVKLLVRYKRFNKAKFHLKKAMELDPSKLDYRLLYAEIFYEEEGTDSAIGYLFDVLKDFPDNPRIIGAIGIYYYKSGQIKSFNRMKERLVNLPRNDSALYKFLIEAARLDDNQADVIKYSKKMIELDPGNLEIRLSLSQIYINQKKYEEALKELEEIQKRFSTYPRLQYFFAKLYLLIGEIDKSIKLAKKEIEENPSVIDSFLLLGDIYKEKKEYILANKYYLQANKIDSKNVDSILGLAIIDFYSDKYDMALDQYIKAKELDPNRAEIYRLLGDVYRKLGQSQLAITNYKFYLELEVNSPFKNKIQTYINNLQ